MTGVERVDLYLVATGPLLDLVDVLALLLGRNDHVLFTEYVRGRDVLVGGVGQRTVEAGERVPGHGLGHEEGLFEIPVVEGRSGADLEAGDFHETVLLFVVKTR